MPYVRARLRIVPSSKWKFQSNFQPQPRQVVTFYFLFFNKQGEAIPRHPLLGPATMAIYWKQAAFAAISTISALSVQGFVTPGASRPSVGLPLRMAEEVVLEANSITSENIR